VAVNVGNPVYVLDAVLPFSAAGFTSAANGDISLLRLPPGNIRIRLDLSYLTCPAGTATSDLDIGLAAYTKADGTTQTIQGSLLADSLDVGGGALSLVLPGNPAATSIVVNSTDGVVIVASFDTANSPASGNLVLKLVYQRE
jgi:hypothetical protein